VDARWKHAAETDITTRVSGGTYRCIFSEEDGLIFHNPIGDNHLM